MLSISHRVSSQHWGRAREQYREALERPAMPWNLKRQLTPADVWLLGPEAKVSIRGADATAVYVGSLVYLTSGLSNWQRNSTTSFIWVGEPVWQTPDLEVQMGEETTTFRLRYRRAQSVTASTGEAKEAVARFVLAVEADIRAHAPEVLAIVDWAQASPATE